MAKNHKYITNVAYSKMIRLSYTVQYI